MITSLYAALLGFMFIYLSALVIKGRAQAQVALGIGSSRSLEQRVRAHANFSEYVPFFIMLLYMLENQGIHVFIIHLFGCVFLVGRAFHAYSLVCKEKYDGDKIITSLKYRKIGMFCTFGMLFLVSLLNLWLFIQNPFD